MDVEKTMQFLLEQQARFDARQAEIVARQAEFAAEFAEQQGQSHERMTRVESVMLDVATAHKRTNAILATLTERHVELAQSHKELSAAQKSAEQRLETVFEAQKATEQSLNRCSRRRELPSRTSTL